jgi:hypothetical protein
MFHNLSHDAIVASMLAYAPSLISLCDQHPVGAVITLCMFGLMAWALR